MVGQSHVNVEESEDIAMLKRRYAAAGARQAHGLQRLIVFIVIVVVTTKLLRPGVERAGIRRRVEEEWYVNRGFLTFAPA